MPKTDAITPSTETADLIKAIATGDTSAVDMNALQALVKAMGLDLVAGEGASGPAGDKRVDIQRRWASGTAITDTEKELMERLPEVIGTAPILTDDDTPRDFSTVEVDAIAAEEAVLRPLEDSIKGRRAAINRTVKTIVSVRNDNDPNATGTIPSVANRVKLVVGVQDKTPKADVNDLRDVVSEEVWEAITVTERVVDPELLTQAMAEGKVSMADMEAITPEAKFVRTYTVRTIKEGDKV